MKPKVYVLMGGRSLERDVSLSSGRRVERALRERGYPVKAIDVDENLVPTLLSERPDLVYIALHGKDGEDGTVQEILEVLEIPYTGPGPLPSMIGFNKILSKEIFIAEGIPTPDYFALSERTLREMGASALLETVWKKLGSPVVVKPAEQGSSLGVSLVSSPQELPGALVEALGYDSRVIIEKYVRGTEVAVSIIGDNPPQTLPPVEIVPRSGFFDFDARYTPGKTDYYIPARLPAEVLAEVERVALMAHRTLRCRELSRVDMIVAEADHTPFVLELNISPGMTETSLLPLAAEAKGLSFEDLVEQLVAMALPERAE